MDKVISLSKTWILTICFLFPYISKSPNEGGDLGLNDCSVELLNEVDIDVEDIILLQTENH